MVHCNRIGIVVRATIEAGEHRHLGARDGVHWSPEGARLLLRALGLALTDRRDAYYAALLRSLGCTAQASVFAEMFDDDVAVQRELKTLDLGPNSGPHYIALTEDENEFVTRAIQRSHAAVRLEPDTQIDEFAAQSIDGGRHLCNVTPVHAHEKDS